MGKENSERHLLKLIDFIEDYNDIWIVFQIGGRSLSSLTFKIKGEFYNSERIYRINKGVFLNHLFTNKSLFKDLIRKMLSFIQFTSGNNIVHSDIKPDNILIEFGMNSNNKEMFIKDLKVIDFGSAFYINYPDNFSSNTPEYMSPEICDLLEKNSGSKDIVNFLGTLNSWVIDIWSLGITILELLMMCPLWINYKCIIEKRGKVNLRNFNFDKG